MTVYPWCHLICCNRNPFHLLSKIFAVTGNPGDPYCYFRVRLQSVFLTNLNVAFPPFATLWKTVICDTRLLQRFLSFFMISQQKNFVNLLDKVFIWKHLKQIHFNFLNFPNFHSFLFQFFLFLYQ